MPQSLGNWHSLPLVQMLTLYRKQLPSLGSLQPETLPPYRTLPGRLANLSFHVMLNKHSELLGCGVVYASIRVSTAHGTEVFSTCACVFLLFNSSINPVRFPGLSHAWYNIQSQLKVDKSNISCVWLLVIIHLLNKLHLKINATNTNINFESYPYTPAMSAGDVL